MTMMKTKGYSKGGKMKTKGYAKGGKLEMVEKGGKKVPFYAADGKGKMAGGGKVKTKGYASGGVIGDSMPGVENLDKEFGKKVADTNEKAGDAIKERARKAKERKDQSNKPRNLTAEEKKANADKEADRRMKEAASRFGMKAGGKVKKSKTKGYAKGGKVRGAGIAKKGVKPCKMR
jgi:gas vesicle protein